jgi:hypothetical protein
VRKYTHGINFVCVENCKSRREMSDIVCVSLFCTSLFQNVFRSNKYLAKSTKTYPAVRVNIHQKRLLNLYNLNENPLNGSAILSCVRVDGKIDLIDASKERNAPEMTYSRCE